MYWDLIVLYIFQVFVVLELFLRCMAQILHPLHKINPSLKTNFLNGLHNLDRLYL